MNEIHPSVHNSDEMPTQPLYVIFERVSKLPLHIILFAVLRLFEHLMIRLHHKRDARLFDCQTFDRSENDIKHSRGLEVIGL
jgi:hypothetical protein